jgi:HEAT repeats
VSPQDQDGISQSQDPRLQPTPDYGTLGPSSDFSLSPAESSPAPSVSDASDRLRPAGRPLLLSIMAMVGGVVAALVSLNSTGPLFAGKKVVPVSAKQRSLISGSIAERELDRQKPQQQAEILLTRAVSRSHGAADQAADQNNEGQNRAQIEAQIEARIEGWRGKLEWNPQLSQLTTAALNSDDESTRNSAIEVQLAAYGLQKNDATVDAIVRQADSSNHKERIWAMWTLGLLGNRGVETDRVVQVLTAHLQSSAKGSARDRALDDEDVRHWAVEGLALVGTTSTIAPLLDAMHDDPSPLVRESAACTLAESGMLTHDHRLTAVPQLISYSDDTALDAQTHALAFQALAEITRQRLPNDSGAWREWYRTAVISGQWASETIERQRPTTDH